MITDQNYCYVCGVKVTYDEEKIKSLKKIAFICNSFLEIKEDIQLCIDLDPSCQDFWMHHYRKTLVTGFGNFNKKTCFFFSDYFFVYFIGIFFAKFFFATFSVIILLQLLFEIFIADAISKVY